MAFIQRSGSSFQTRHGITGEVLSTFASQEKAEEELARLHKKNMPSPENRGKRASTRLKRGK